MTDTLLGALKAVAPFLLSAVLIGVDRLFGRPVNLDELHTILVGAITSIAVYLVPNLRKGY